MSCIAPGSLLSLSVWKLFCKHCKFEAVSAIVLLHGIGSLSEFEGFDRLYPGEVQQLVECAFKIATGAVVITESVRAKFDRASNQIVEHLNVTGRGPQDVATTLRRKYTDAASKAAWVRQARTNALLGSCPKSKASLRCGARNYISFAENMLDMPGRELPPTVDGLLAWSTTFRCHKTFSNYLSHVRLACALIGVQCDAAGDPVIKRAKATIRKNKCSLRGQRCG